MATRQKLDKRKLGRLLKQVNEERFKGKLRIENERGCFVVEDIPVWVNKKGQVEVRHSAMGDVGWWVDIIVRHAIAEKVDGRISDEGTIGWNKPHLDRYLGFWKFRTRSWPLGTPPPPRWMKAVEHLCLMDVKNHPRLKKLVMADYDEWKSWKKAQRKRSRKGRSRRSRE